MAITSIPNKTFEHNAWGFQLIKVIEIKTLMPLQAGCLAGLNQPCRGSLLAGITTRWQQAPSKKGPTR